MATKVTICVLYMWNEWITINYAFYGIILHTNVRNIIKHFVAAIKDLKWSPSEGGLSFRKYNVTKFCQMNVLLLYTFVWYTHTVDRIIIIIFDIKG